MSQKKINKNQQKTQNGDFEYVVTLAERAKICFGMGSSRKCLPTSVGKMGSFQARTTIVTNPNLGPGVYNPLGQDAFANSRTMPLSTRGYGGLCYTAPRLRMFTFIKQPGPASYNVTRPSKFSKNKHGFNSTSKRQQKRGVVYPAPTDYITHKKCFGTGIPYAESFGGKRCMLPAVPCKCAPYNTDRCAVCNELPAGDYYYHKKKPNVFICLNCLRLETVDHYMFDEDDIKQFERFRDCSYMHQHEGAVSAIRLMTQQQINKKMRMEAYLKQYFPLQV